MPNINYGMEPTVDNPMPTFDVDEKFHNELAAIKLAELRKKMKDSYRYYNNLNNLSSNLRAEGNDIEANRYEDQANDYYDDYLNAKEELKKLQEK